MKPLGAAGHLWSSRDVRLTTPVCALSQLANATVSLRRGGLRASGLSDMRTSMVDNATRYDTSLLAYGEPEETTLLRKDDAVNVYAQFRLNGDLPPGAFVDIWLPRFRANDNEIVALDEAYPASARWTAAFVTVNSSTPHPAKPRPGAYGVVLRLNASKGLDAADMAGVAIATERSGAAPALRPPADRLRPLRRDGDAFLVDDDVVAISSTHGDCPLAPTALSCFRSRSCSILRQPRRRHR